MPTKVLQASTLPFVALASKIIFYILDKTMFMVWKYKERLEQSWGKEISKQKTIGQKRDNLQEEKISYIEKYYPNIEDSPNHGTTCWGLDCELVGKVTSQSMRQKQKNLTDHFPNISSHNIFGQYGVCIIVFNFENVHIITHEK